VSTAAGRSSKAPSQRVHTAHRNFQVLATHLGPDKLHAAPKSMHRGQCRQPTTAPHGHDLLITTRSTTSRTSVYNISPQHAAQMTLIVYAYTAGQLNRQFAQSTPHTEACLHKQRDHTLTKAICGPINTTSAVSSRTSLPRPNQQRAGKRECTEHNAAEAVTSILA
jgi:hypothetical protein